MHPSLTTPAIGLLLVSPTGIANAVVVSISTNLPRSGMIFISAPL